MKKVLLLLILLVSLKGYSQKDSIVNFLDRKGKIIKNKEKARSFEIITKESDSLWLTRRYRRNGKQTAYWFTKDKKREIKIGESITYNLSGKVSSIVYYNIKGNKSGYYKSWFDSTAKNIEGIYVDGNKEGVWKYYHYNGNIACRRIYKKDSILKSVYYNEKGVEMEYNKENIEEKPKFKGGEKKFIAKVKKIYSNLGYNIKGKIHVNFIINIHGKITDVRLDEELVEKLENKIVNFFENIKGWSPGMHLNRKYPVSYSIPLNFRG